MATRTAITLPPRTGWLEFLDHKFPWKQGEHVTLLGHTGSGKTTLARHILTKRDYVVIVATKPKDESLDIFGRQDGFKVSGSWPIDSAIWPRVVYWPKIKKVTDVDMQANSIGRMLASIYRTGGWTVYLDEVRYITDTLGLKRAAELLWLQGRSLRLSLVAGTQRPAWIPLEAYSQASHIFIWRDRDDTNLKRLQGIGSVDHKELKAMIQNLPLHDVLYVNTRTGEVIRTRVGI